MSEGENRRVVVMVKGRDAVLTHSIGFLVINGGLVRDMRSGAPSVEVLRKNSQYRGCSVESRCLVLSCVVLFSC